MDYTQFILAVNAASITILLLLAGLLLASTKFKGMNGYAALITTVPTVPVYLYNMSRMMGWHGLSVFMLPLSFSVNTTLMPLLWLFTRMNFDPDFRMDFRKMLHFVPAIVFLVLSLMMDRQERMDQILFEMTGKDAWMGNLNTYTVLFQIIGYYTAIFVYIGRVRKRISDTSSDAEWLQKLWIPKFMALFFVLFVIAHVFLVLTTGALRNLNHMYAAQGSTDPNAYADNWTGFWMFFASMVVIVAAYAANRPLVLAPIARLFGNVSGR